MNTLILVKISNVTYDEWKKKFDSDSEAHSKMMRNTLVGKVDEKTAMISTEIFDQEMVGLPFLGRRFQCLSLQFFRLPYQLMYFSSSWNVPQNLSQIFSSIHRK